MFKSNINKLVIFIIALLIIFTFVACKKPEVTPSPTPTPKEKTVIECVDLLLTAIDNSSKLISTSEVIHIDLTAQYTNSGITYDILFKANIEPTGNPNRNNENKVYFEIRNGTAVYLGVYYNNSSLYLNLPTNGGQSSEKFYVSNLNISDIISFLNISDDEESGSGFSGMSNIIAAFVKSATYSVQGEEVTLVFNLDLGDAVSTLLNLITSNFEGVNIDDILGMIGFSADTFIDTVAGYNNAQFTVIIADEYLSRMSFNNGEGTNFSLNTFNLSSGEGSFNIPINISQYTEYSPTNLDISGSIVLDLKTGTFITPISGVNVTSNLTATQFTYNFRIRAKISLLAPVNDRILVELSSPGEWAISLYYDGSTRNIYADLSQINAGKLMMNADALYELINSLATELPSNPLEPTEDSFNADINSILKVIGIIAPGVDLGSNQIDVEFDPVRFRDLFAAFGITLPLDITSAGASIERDGYTVNSVDMWIEAGGIKLSLQSNNVSVGPLPTIPVPSGLGSYVNAETVEIFTIFMNGSIDLKVGTGDVISFLEGALSNITGSAIDLNPQFPPSGTLLDYRVKIGIDAEEGTLDNLTIDLYDTLGRYIVGITYLDSTEKVYIIEQINVGGTIVNVSNEYDLSYNVLNMMKLITGLNNPLAPTSPDDVSITNSLLSLTVSMNYNAFYTFIEYLGNTLFNATESFSSDYIFNNISLTLGNGFVGIVNFPNNKSITLQSDDISIGYTTVSVIGIVEPTSRSINSVYANNNMPEVITLRFSDGTQKAFKVSEWSYNLTGFVNSVGGTVVASTYIMGHRVDINLNVAGTNISSLISTVPNSGFTFNKNNMSVDPIDVIRAYNQITVRIATTDIVKVLDWDLSALEGANTNGEYNVQGIIYDYFGRPKLLPDTNLYYKVVISGTDVVSHTLNRVLDSYSGIDPTNVNSYPALAKLTAEGVITTDPAAIGEIVNLEWNLGNIISAFNTAGFKAYEQGLNINVSVNIPNAFGTPRTLPVNVLINPAVMTGIHFTDALLGNGSPIDLTLDTTATASGISWDAVNNRLVINPMRIRALSEAVLPASVTMVTSSGSFVFRGLKWEFMPLDINNSGGTYNNILKLTIGDSIGGYQSIFVTVHVVEILISDFEILNNDGDVITTSNLDELYKLYHISNPYNYYMPLKTKVFTNLDDFILTTNWSFPTFNTATLFNVNTHEGTYQAGSQLLKVRITTQPTIAVMVGGLSFRPEDTAIVFDENKGLVFNPYTSADFTDISIYPATGLATFTDGAGITRQLVVPLTWNISAITSLYSGSNPNMYQGRSITVTATTNYPDCGSQQFSVNVYVEEALIDASAVVYSLFNPTKILDMAIFGVDGDDLTFIDPRLTASYPSSIRVSYMGATLPSRIIPMNPENVTVGSWNISSVLTAYNQATIISGVSGTYNIVATVGTVRGGYQTVTMQVNITSAELSEVLFTNIPLLPDGEPAFNYDDTETADYIATFTFDPYAANIKNAISYPSKMTFDLDIDGIVHSLNKSIIWNLSSVLNISPYQGGTYIVEARLPLSSTGYLPVPVRIILTEKMVDTLNGQGLFNIFIDPLDNTPFGRRNSTSNEVRQTVEVTFTGDSTVMTLNLIYSRENISVDFGGNLYLIDAVVGNDFGGYQPIGMDGKIQVATIQREITNIHTDDGEMLELYRREELEVLDGLGNVDYIIISEYNPNILYYEVKPETLLFTFTGMADPIAIPLKTELSVGLCYDWVYISDTLCEIVIYNIIPAFIVNDVDTVFIGNPRVNLDVVELIDVNGILITQGSYGVSFTGAIVDIITELNTMGKIRNIDYDITTDYLIYELYLNGVIIDPSTVRDSGEYTLRIYVKGHTVYGGYDEVLYTIYKDDISSNINIYRKIGEGPVTYVSTGVDVAQTIEYTGVPIVYSADSLPLNKDIDVIYPDGHPINVGVYVFDVQVNPNHPNEVCYITITLTITKVLLNATSPDVSFVHPASIIYGSSAFATTLSAYGNPIDSSDYTIEFFEDISCTIPVIDISNVNVGTYYVRVFYSELNFEIDGVKSFNVSPATIVESDYTFTSSDMSQGESGPLLTLVIFDNSIVLDDVVPSYYSDEECTVQVIDITSAGTGLYYVKITVEIDNYMPIDIVESFYITSND